MSNLMDRQELTKAIDQLKQYGFEIVEKRKTGKWENRMRRIFEIKVYDHIDPKELERRGLKPYAEEYIDIAICSVCKERSIIKMGEAKETFWDNANYCPNCGADMRGEE